MRRSIFLMWLLTALMGAAKGKPPANGLSGKSQAAIEAVEAAYLAGNAEQLWHALAPSVNGLKEDAAAKFDEALAAKKLPPARELLVQARLKLLMEDRTGALPAPSLKERLLILAALQDHLQNPLEQIAGQSLLEEDTPPPANMDEFDRRLHDIHEVQAKLWLAKTCAHYGKDLAGKLPEAARKKLTDKEQETVAHSEGGLATKVADAERDVRELELETRLLRLKYGVEVLQQKPLTKEKFFAAATTRQDARALKQELEPATPVQRKGTKAKAAAAKAAANPPPPVVFHRAALTSPDLANEVATLARHAQEAAGPLADKAERFLAGLELWLRGRYGWGPDVGGLAKSSAALEQPELLQQVSMPENLLTLADEKEQPKQEDAGRRTEAPSTKTEKKPRQTPRCPDRRHYYTWGWEDRMLVSTMNKDPGYKLEHDTLYANGKSSGWWDVDTTNFNIARFRPGFRRLNNDRFFWNGEIQQAGTDQARLTEQANITVSVPPQDPRLVYRIVGFIEYALAVQHLDKFAEEATIGEFEVAEEIIRSQDAFIIQTNLSRKIEGPTTLSEQSPNPRDDFNRHGLEWMLALARVELGAMLAGFTSHAEPFLSLAPTTYRQERVKTVPFGRAAYAELLMDGLRCHYWSIVRQDLIPGYYKTGVPENHLLTQIRRAVVGRQFVRAALKFSGSGNGGENLPQQQRTELQSWNETFEKLQRIMEYCLTFKVGSTNVTATKWFSLNSITATTDRDRTPDAIRRIMLLADPTLAGCGCK